jgi:hypothetical protein
MNLYHVSNAKIKPGDSILPYGRGDVFLHNVDALERLIRSVPELALKEVYKLIPEGATPCESPYSTAFIEAVFELIRKDEFPNKPPRVGSSFVFEDPLLCIGFWNHLRTGNPYLYECESKGNIIFHRGDFSLLKNVLNVNYSTEINLTNMFTLARKYWKAEESLAVPEIHILGLLRVKKRLPIPISYLQRG